MAKNFNMKIENQDRWVRAFKSAPQEAKKELQDAMEIAVGTVKGEAKLVVPVDLGRLRASITGDINPARGRIFTDVEYAEKVHTATFQPRIKSKDPLFLSNPLERNKDFITKLFNKHLNNVLRTIAKQT